MDAIDKTKKRYGLVGRNISYSFSKPYFTKKFTDSGLSGYTYENFDLAAISEFEALVQQNVLHGVNVTIPYKQKIIPYLDVLSKEAERIGAVNTIKFEGNQLVGYNTDAFGFEKSLSPLLAAHHKKALVLGTGGASRAVVFVLDRLGIDFTHVSRDPNKEQFGYSELKKTHFQEFQLIINCTPVGTFPNVTDKPQIPYECIESTHILYDLIYNPEETAFLSEGKKRGAIIQNGLPMLQFQAERAWQIWNS